MYALHTAQNLQNAINATSTITVSNKEIAHAIAHTSANALFANNYTLVTNVNTTKHTMQTVYDFIAGGYYSATMQTYKDCNNNLYVLADDYEEL